LDRVLDDCLTRLANGESTVEECLARYPEYASELRRLLTAAEQLEPGRQVQPASIFKARTRAQLTEYMQEHPRGRQVRERSDSLWPRLYFPFGRFFNFASGVAAVIFLVLMTGTVLAQMALPGDALYGWRVTSEQVWRTLHPHPFVADLALARRHAQDLTRVAGNETAEIVARRDYEQSLEVLAFYKTPQEQKVISETLAEQKARLTQAQVSVPELDQLLRAVSLQETSLQLDHQVASVENGRVTYQLTVTNQGPAGPAVAVIVDTLSPAETLESTGGGNCAVLPGGRINCTVANLAVNASRTLTLTTTLDRCYEGAISNTAVVTGTESIINVNLDNEAAAGEDILESISQSAQVVYVQSDGRTHNLVAISSGGSPLDLGLPVHTAAPAWSPDGTKIAFFGEQGISELGGVFSQGNGIWLMDIVNGRAQNPRQLVGQDHVSSISWSPDGQWLAFEVGPPDLPHEIMIAGTRDGQIISRFPGEQPAWYPDSRKLVIKSCAPDCGLWQVNSDGSGAKQITFHDTDSYPVWSPTGESLAFTSERDGNWEVYLLHETDRQPVRLTNRAGTDTTPVFDSCARQVYIRTDHFGSWWITMMRVDGSDERKVQEGVGVSEDWGLARPSVY
jgi:hypothetical protein